MKKAIVFLFSAALVLGFVSSASAKKLPPKLLNGFEKDTDISELFKENNGSKDYVVEKSTEHVTQGKYSCKIAFPKDGDWPGPHFIKFDGNWDGYDTLKFDVFNDTKQVCALNFTAIDKDSKITAENYFGEYALRYSVSSILKPGANTFEVELAGATVEDKSRALDIANIKKFSIFAMARPEGFTIYLDNIRLEQIEE